MPTSLHSLIASLIRLRRRLDCRRACAAFSEHHRRLSFVLDRRRFRVPRQPS